MSEKTYSDAIAEAVKSVLDDNEWSYKFDKELGLFKFGLGLDGKLKKVNSILDVGDDEYMVYTYCPIGVDENDTKMMLRMTEFICRVNYGLKTGNFELDCNDGEIRFKCHVMCEDIIPTAAIINRSIFTCVLMFERYGSGILDIIFTDVSPKDAVYKCENSKLDMYRRIREALNGEDDSDDSDEDEDEDEEGGDVEVEGADDEDGGAAGAGNEE